MPRKTSYSASYRKRQKKRAVIIAVVCLIAILALSGIINVLQADHPSVLETGQSTAADFVIPQYAGAAYVEINGNIPFFLESDVTTTAFEEYSPLDRLGRCGPATACLGRELMPTEERGEIGMIKPSGWHTVRYDDLIEDKFYVLAQRLSMDKTAVMIDCIKFFKNNYYTEVNEICSHIDTILQEL